jgi:8-oxo-dGTP pyrophosphatase MutT (NUDIX family)
MTFSSSCHHFVIAASATFRTASSFNRSSIAPTSVIIRNLRSKNPKRSFADEATSKMSAKVVKASMSQKAKGPPMEPRPSSSVLLISPTNQVLLLHRVRTSSSFPSAHVFPGGNVSTKHDGVAPKPSHPERHVDSKVYRMAAIRETFEESGILLARKKGTSLLLDVPEAEREQGRKDIHAGRVSFPDWLAKHSGEADTGTSLFNNSTRDAN